MVGEKNGSKQIFSGFERSVYKSKDRRPLKNEDPKENEDLEKDMRPPRKRRPLENKDP